MRIAAAQHPARDSPPSPQQIKRGGSQRRASSRSIWFRLAKSSDLLRTQPGAYRYSTVQALPVAESKAVAVTTTMEPSFPDLASLEGAPGRPTAQVPSYPPAASVSIADTRPACCAARRAPQWFQ